MKMDMPDSSTVDEALALGLSLGVFGPWPRVLCVCSAAINRSPTLAWVLSRDPYCCNTIAVGSHLNKALIPISQHLLNWAEKVVFANPENAERVASMGLRTPTEQYILKLPDSFSYRDPGLISLIHEELTHARFHV